MKLLVTGGAGFIGSNFIHYWLEKHPKDEITNFDKLTYAGHLSSTKDFQDNKNYKFVRGDICIKDDVEKAIRDIDVITHFAAESIPEHVYIPIYSPTGTKLFAFWELWEQQRMCTKVVKTPKGEAIFLKGKQTKVLSFLNGGQWMPIKAITRHKYKGNIIKLNQKWGCIETTPNHSIYSSSLELTTPLKNPELLVVNQVNEIRKKYKKVNKDLLTILAAYITEGNATFNKANGGYIIEIGQKQKSWLEDLGIIIKKTFGYNYWITKGRKGKFSFYHLQVSNKKLYEFLIKNCGRYSDNKYFPNWIFDLNIEDREFFWKKLLEGDGTKDGRYTTTSYKLANQVSLLLALQNNKFIFSERSPLKYKKSYNFRTNLTGSHYGLNLKKKETVSYKGWVYDIEVGKTHNFICGIGNIVCHNTHVDRSILGPAPFIKTNVLGTQVLLESALKHKVKRFHYVGTDEVFGALPLNSKLKFNELSLYDPRSPYSASKAASDHLVRAYFHTYGLPITITNCSNNFGPFQDPEKFLPRMITNLIEGKEILIYGDGKYVRDWLYVDDHCSAIEKVILKGKEGDTYLIGGLTRDINNLEVAQMLLKIFKKDKTSIKFIKDRPGHDRRYAVDWNKIKFKLKWEPKHDFETWLEKTVKWYQDNQWWWKPLKKKAEMLYNLTGQK